VPLYCTPVSTAPHPSNQTPAAAPQVTTISIAPVVKDSPSTITSPPAVVGDAANAPSALVAPGAGANINAVPAKLAGKRRRTYSDLLFAAASVVLTAPLMRPPVIDVSGDVVDPPHQSPHRIKQQQQQQQQQKPETVSKSKRPNRTLDSAPAVVDQSTTAPVAVVKSEADPGPASHIGSKRELSDSELMQLETADPSRRGDWTTRSGRSPRGTRKRAAPTVLSPPTKPKLQRPSDDTGAGSPVTSPRPAPVSSAPAVPAPSKTDEPPSDPSIRVVNSDITAGYEPVSVRVVNPCNPNSPVPIMRVLYSD